MVYEAIDDPELRHMPGADGHSGIEGLGANKKGKVYLTPTQKNFLDELARVCEHEDFQL